MEGANRISWYIAAALHQAIWTVLRRKLIAYALTNVGQGEQEECSVSGI